jgi:hypothetical protein
MQQRVDEGTRERRGSYFARQWRGDLSLPKSFWLNGILIFGLGYNFLMALTNLPLFFSESASWTIGNQLNIVLVDLAILVIAYVWAVVGLWRSAKRYQGPIIWSILARVAILFGILSILPWMMLWVAASRMM